jgi:hypothetical protein
MGDTRASRNHVNLGMATVTLELPDSLAQRVKPLSRWLPTILEINFLSLKTPAAQTANEVIDFLAKNPTAKEVYKLRPSPRSQERTAKLLSLNSEGAISGEEKIELEELAILENLLISLKASLSNDEIA